MVSHKASILLVDDDPEVVRIMRRTLTLEGYAVLVAYSGQAALKAFEGESPDLVILDVMLPELDGYAVCRRIREFSQVPIIMVTAKERQDEKLKGFECGADDYITKPFSPKELVARVQAVLRRIDHAAPAARQPGFKSGELEVDFVRRRVTVSGSPVGLTPTEYRLLHELVLNEGKVLTHTQLLQRVWGAEYRDEKEYLHVFIGRLRSKLFPAGPGRRYIQTVPGVGYQFSDLA